MWRRPSRGNERKILFHEETFRLKTLHPLPRHIPTRGWRIQPKRIRENPLRGVDAEGRSRLAFSPLGVLCENSLTPETLKKRAGTA